MFTSFRLSRASRPGPRLIRCLSSVARERAILLSKIYAPFSKLEKDSPEYKELALSGKVWEDYYQPGDSERYGYGRLQQLYSPILREIDSLKESIMSPMSTIVKSLIPEYAHQSVQIENNTLKLSESVLIEDHLRSTLFKNINLASISARELSQIDLPDVHHLVPRADASQVAELRNHIVASHWVTETALQNTSTTGLSEDDVRHLSAVIIKGTNAEAVYALGWGPRVLLGGYRQAPIGAKSNPLRIFPYHLEVPALMQRFFQWRETANNGQNHLHPLILACQALAYFLHIHPFPDGNGRVSRLMMQDYMIRWGYVPLVFQCLEREDYLGMVKDAQDGEPGELVARVVTTQLEEMQTFRMREMGMSVAEW